MNTRHILVPGLTLLLAALGCSAEPAHSGAASLQVDSLPSLSIGVAEGTPALELDRANSALRLADGRIVVANSGTDELRFFDSTGASLASVGRNGEGPGEFSGGMTLYPGSGDSLVVYDAGARRFTVTDRDGHYVRMYPAVAGGRTSFPWDDWLQGRAWVRGVRDTTLRPCVAAILTRLGPPPAAVVRQVRVDGRHTVWIRQLSSPNDDPANTWVGYTITGDRLGQVALPAGLEPYQFGSDFVLGRRRDADGIEQIQLYGLHGRTDQMAGCPASAASGDSINGAPAGGDVPPGVIGDLRNLTVAQEMFYAGHGHYAVEADSVPWKSGSGSELWLMRGDDHGWAGALVLPEGDRICAVAIGDQTPAGWMEGSPRCGR
ncbi:MAG TPA: hypothetical protein VFL95_07705 [Gemmatimonadales bacterium]|nr:hypothetical protein [Gemmatimonadales bacterium]